MRRCPQCRISLRYISRNRGLEQLARITFPQEEVMMELDQMRDVIGQMLEVGRLTGSMD